jgi:membrane protease YdiL (CAAX protease family)
MQLTGAVVATAPLAIFVLWMRHGPPTLGQMLGGPLLGGGSLILWLLFIQVILAGDPLTSLGLRTDRMTRELLLGVVGAAVMLALHAGIGALLSEVFPPQPAPPEIRELLEGLSRRPELLVLWLGPVVWIGVAGFEELWRIHLLRRLWVLWPGPAGRWGSILISALLVAAAHAYQPPAVRISIGLLSVLQGWYFLFTGRFWSLVIAHALYDSLQVVTIVLLIRGAL